jgi:hypothetical protein
VATVVEVVAVVPVVVVVVVVAVQVPAELVTLVLPETPEAQAELVAIPGAPGAQAVRPEEHQPEPIAVARAVSVELAAPARSGRQASMAKRVITGRQGQPLR